MNKIHNHLERPGILTINDIKWVPNPNPGFSRKRNLLVPSVISSYINAKGVAIWNYYFLLLFHRFDLMRRLEKNKTALYIYAKPLYDHLFATDGNINKDNLLNLLIENPKKYVNIFDIKSVQAHEIITKVFNYTVLSGETYKEQFITLIQMLNVNVCPYCGRAFTTTIIQNNFSNARTCQVDHFYPQSKYPWLAISLWNFIPVCGFCNLHKSDNTEDAILYPYEEEIGNIYRFSTHPTKGVGYLVGARDSEDNFIVSLDPVVEHDNPEEASSYKNKIDNEIKMFKINELYSTHNSYVCNIFRQRYIFGDPYINSIFSSFKNIFNDPEDVRAMMYLKRIDADSIGSNPLDKLTRDIDHEIDLLK